MRSSLHLSTEGLPAAAKPAGAYPSRAGRRAVLWLAHDIRRKTRFFEAAEAVDRQASARLELGCCWR